MFKNEYRACHAQENRWVDSLPCIPFLDDEESLDLIKFVCSAFECDQPSKVQFAVPLPPRVTGDYLSDSKTIRIASITYADIALIAHELAHHIHYELYYFSYFFSGFVKGHHGRRFLDIERRIFRVAEQWVKR